MSEHIKEGGKADDDSLSKRMFDPQIGTAQIPLHPMPVQPMPIINLPDIPAQLQQKAASPKKSGLLYIALLISILLSCYSALGVTYILLDKQQCSCTTSQQLATSDLNTNVTASTTTPSPTLIPSLSPSLFPSLTYSTNSSLNPSVNPSLNPSSNPSLNPSLTPSSSPSSNPSVNPSLTPSTNPSLNPSLIPSLSPTTSLPTTAFPTAAPSFSNSVIGDYKISAQNLSHGHWLLCDGSFVDSTNYPELFNIIQYSFGSFSGYPLLFRLPNLSDNLIGLTGTNHFMGESVGTESITLSQANIPSHFHYLANPNGAVAAYSASTPYLAYLGSSSSGSPYYYQFQALGSPPTIYKSSSTGNGASFNIMPPTIFVGNLFIYSG